MNDLTIKKSFFYKIDSFYFIMKNSLKNQKNVISRFQTLPKLNHISNKLSNSTQTP